MKLLLAFITLGLGFLYLKNSSSIQPPAVGTTAPIFSLIDQNGETKTLADYQGEWLVLYFYPKDDTPGCTKEACFFRDDMTVFKTHGANIVGISIDDPASHAAFSEKYHLTFTLLSDETGEVASQYGALRDLGVTKLAKRYTFLIDPNGRIAKVYEEVDVASHSKVILQDLKQLSAS